MDITVELVKVFMTWWDKKMIRRLQELNINPILYKRYVDDINIAVNKVDDGYGYVGGNIVIQEGDDRNDIEVDKRTFDVIRRVGNEVHESIQLTADVATDHEDCKVPILDLKCWIKEVEIDGSKNYTIMHEHYIKDMSSRAVIHRESALSLCSKRTILTQECLRVMMNCHELIGWDKIAEHLSYFMARMQAAGYDKSFRLQVVKSEKK